MTWLLPQAPAFKGRARTVGEPDSRQRLAANKRRYLQSERGRATTERNRQRRAAYHREYRIRNIEKLRAYQAMKMREYRARKP